MIFDVSVKVLRVLIHLKKEVIIIKNVFQKGIRSNFHIRFQYDNTKMIDIVNIMKILTDVKTRHVSNEHIDVIRTYLIFIKV